MPNIVCVLSPSKMSVNLSASLLKPLSSDEKPIVAVRIFPNALDLSAPRASKHLALLIDTSGSMDGDRIDTVKRTIHLLADSLPEGGRLTLIQYSSDSTVLVLNTSDRASVRLAADNLVACGGTNLEAGMFKLRELMATTTVDSVFLLTDGHINEGVTSSVGLLRILGADVPPLNTLGFGVDYNSQTLKNLSVSTRGSHTYADAAELIPAIIGDIVGGLSAEVGTNAKFSIPAGWRCLELGYEAGDDYYKVGSLIAEKDQWVVLEGPANITELPTMTLTWTNGSITTSVDFAIDESNAKEVVCEQLNRTKVMSTFGRVTGLLENGSLDLAKAELVALLADIGTSIAKDRLFVVHLMAQIDEMLEELNKPYMRAHRHNAVNSGVVPRMVSNQVALGVQRGIVSRLQSVQISADNESNSAPPRALTGVMASFSSPVQREVSRGMSDRYSQQDSDPGVPNTAVRYITRI